MADAPDGSGSEEFYGDNIANPGVLWQARQVPGHPRLAVCLGCGHEPLGVGQVLLLDLNKDKRTPAPMTSLTPEVKTEGIRGLYQLRNGVSREDIYGPFYSDPYPLSDKFFLVSCNPAGRYNSETAYGIYLLDVFGNRVPIYHDPEISCWQPMPLRPRQTPPIIAPVANAEMGISPGSGVVDGGKEPGDAQPQTDQSPAAGHSGKLDSSPCGHRVPERRLPRAHRGAAGHGEVPSRDGAGSQALGRRGRSAPRRGPLGRRVRRAYRGEHECPHLDCRAAGDRAGRGRRVGLVRGARGQEPVLPGAGRGLHGNPADADVRQFRTGGAAFLHWLSRAADAGPGVAAGAGLRTPPREARRPTRRNRAAPLYYPTDVQPIFDRLCVNCHTGKSPAAGQVANVPPASSEKPPVGNEHRNAEPDLRGELTQHFSRSYENIFAAGLVDTIREWAGATYSMQNAEAVPPYSHGSHRSKLVQVLKAGHYDVQLSREEWIKLVTWIDCGAPYYGSYYGRRNLAYRGQPDFRPVPTLESACGIPPEFPELPKLDPLPAELLAWWPLDEAPGGTTADASANGHPAQVVAAQWAPDDANGSALTLDGKGHLTAGGLGQHEAVSISLWVKPDRLPNRWNALLFTDGGDPGAFHFSLLDTGPPNVAINHGPQQWTHRSAATPLKTGQWRHLVVTCDPRFGGSIVFYIDGNKDAERPLGLGIPLDLDAFRLGTWSNWVSSPGAGFHGASRQRQDLPRRAQ